MPMHPQAQLILDFMRDAGLVIGQSSDPVVVRTQMAEFARAGRAAAEAVHEVVDRTVAGPGGEIPVRIYRPAPETPLPALVWFHGGGWTIGSVETHDLSCRALANAVGCVVVSVDDRLAPEHKFPCAVDDAFAATRWVAGHAADLGVDPARIAVGGDSAGGNLAAVVSLLARDAGGPHLAFQLLVYPVTDYEFESASMVENATGYFLELESMRWFYRQYLNEESDGDDWRFSPIRAADLSGVPPAFVLTAEFDPLRDQGEAYARELEAAAVPVELRRYDGVFHGFFGMRDLMEPAQEAFDDVTKAVRLALGS
ncbi:MAG TPA: alpha/beta hydrolase [Acidimicrobiia bacterium]